MYSYANEGQKHRSDHPLDVELHVTLHGTLTIHFLCRRMAVDQALNTPDLRGVVYFKVCHMA